MPITEQLQTSEQLQQAGLPRAAAVLLAEKIEAAAQATHETALDRFRTELRSEISALDAKMSAKFADVEKSIRISQNRPAVSHCRSSHSDGRAGRRHLDRLVEALARAVKTAIDSFPLRPLPRSLRT